MGEVALRLGPAPAIEGDARREVGDKIGDTKTHDHMVIARFTHAQFTLCVPQVVMDVTVRESVVGVDMGWETIVQGEGVEDIDSVDPLATGTGTQVNDRIEIDADALAVTVCALISPEAGTGPTSSGMMPPKSKRI